MEYIKCCTQRRESPVGFEIPQATVNGVVAGFPSAATRERHGHVERGTCGSPTIKIESFCSISLEFSGGENVLN